MTQRGYFDHFGLMFDDKWNAMPSRATPRRRGVVGTWLVVFMNTSTTFVPPKPVYVESQGRRAVVPQFFFGAVARNKTIDERQRERQNGFLRRRSGVPESQCLTTGKNKGLGRLATPRFVSRQGKKTRETPNATKRPLRTYRHGGYVWSGLDVA